MYRVQKNTDSEFFNTDVQVKQVNIAVTVVNYMILILI
jgi:hypothetical protein